MFLPVMAGVGWVIVIKFQLDRDYIGGGFKHF